MRATLRSFAPDSAPKLIWNTGLGTILSEPAVSNGIVYIVAKTMRSAQLVSIDLASGAESLAAIRTVTEPTAGATPVKTGATE